MPACPTGRWPILDSFATGQYPMKPRTLLNLLAKQLPSYGTSLETAVSDLSHYLDEGYRAVVLVSSQQRADNLQALLPGSRRLRPAVDYALHALPESGKATIAVGGLSAGLGIPGGPLCHPHRGRRGPCQEGPGQGSHQSGQAQLLCRSLPATWWSTNTTGWAAIRRWVKMQWTGGEGLHQNRLCRGRCPLCPRHPAGPGEQIHWRRRGTPRRRKNSPSWEEATGKRPRPGRKRRSRTWPRASFSSTPSGSASRAMPFTPTPEWMREFEEQFEVRRDRRASSAASRRIRRDMETARPMDRLLCGDVGYGKTEVAFRAIMKCVLDGKQAAILGAHHRSGPAALPSAKQRLPGIRGHRRGLPLPHQRPDEGDIAPGGAGGVDLLIGTHRLFQKDVKFKDLGLPGYRRGAALCGPQGAAQGDLQSRWMCSPLSATPIPPTLNMALSGHPGICPPWSSPMDRQPVQTYVLEHDWGVLADAMRRELERGGQIYYLHNRVETITRTAARIKGDAGRRGVRGVAHGKMSQEELNDVMKRNERRRGGYPGVHHHH